MRLALKIHINFEIIVLLSNFSALFFAANHGRLAFIAFSAESS